VCPVVGRTSGNKLRGARILEEDMTSTHQVSDVATACSTMMDVFYAYRVCPGGNPYDWLDHVLP
jgi:hypothetical protein